MYACFCIPGLSAANRARLMRCAETFTPLTEGGADHVLLDLRGMGALLGSPPEMAARMKDHLAAAGLEANIAIAATPAAAEAAARGFAGATVIAPGDEARALAPLPLTVLDPGAELLDVLAAWGIRTFGDLSRLPVNGLTERLGAEGVRLYMRARGFSPAPLVSAQSAPDFSASLDLDHPLSSLEPLAFLLGRLLSEVCGSLMEYGLAAMEIAVTLGLENAAEHCRTLRLPFATVESASLLKLLQYDLAAHPPGAAILRVTLRATPSPQRRIQGGLFRPVAPEAEKLELTLARLAAVVGEGNLGAPELLDTHRPDAFRLKRFTARPDRPPLEAAPETESPPPLVLRRCRPPMPADVLAPHGYPQRVSARDIRGQVVGYGGPWRSSGEWWRSDAWTCDEWDVALDNGSLCRLTREVTGRNAQPRWFLAGTYD